MTRHNHEATLASLHEIGQTLAELQAKPKAEKAEPSEPHEQLAADLHAAQSRWFTLDELAGGGKDAA